METKQIGKMEMPPKMAECASLFRPTLATHHLFIVQKRTNPAAMTVCAYLGCSFRRLLLESEKSQKFSALDSRAG
jgi:hypothetical protein